MFNNKFGDEGFTSLFNKEISKDNQELDFLGDLKEIVAYIRLCINFINPFTFYFINDGLSSIIKTLEDIEKDYSLDENKFYQIGDLLDLESKILELKNKLNGYQNKEVVTNKVSSLVELIYVKCLKLERSYYKLKRVKKYQSYLNRINDYFYLLKDYVNKEM